VRQGAGSRGNQLTDRRAELLDQAVDERVVEALRALDGIE